MARRSPARWRTLGKAGLGLAGLALLAVIAAGIVIEGRDNLASARLRVKGLGDEIAQARAVLADMPAGLTDLQRRLAAARQRLATEADAPATLEALRRTAQEAGVTVTAAALKPPRPRGSSDEIPISLAMRSDAAKLLGFLERADGRFTTLTELFLTVSLDAPTVVSSQVTLTVLVDRPERAPAPPPPPAPPKPAAPATRRP